MQPQDGPDAGAHLVAPEFAGPTVPHLIRVYEPEHETGYDGLARPIVTRHRLGALLGWQFHLPYETNPLPMNGGRGNHYAHAAQAKKVRETAYWLATQVPRQERIRVQLVQHVVSRRTRDADNLGELAKRLVDGLRDDKRRGVTSIVPDDDERYIERLHPAIVEHERSPETPRAYFRLHVWPLMS
jgi:hypothetical protein